MAKKLDIESLYSFLRTGHRTAKIACVKSDGSPVVSPVWFALDGNELVFTTMNIEQLNNSNHTFVIAEAGSNWKTGTFEEDLAQAKRLIDVACESGADAVKFQTYRPETVYASNAGNSNYLVERGIDADIHSIFKKHSMIEIVR